MFRELWVEYSFFFGNHIEIVLVTGMQPSFCRVTGNSRNLPKPNYFPLLPAISPAEARRLCHPSPGGGSSNSAYHLYIPVIEFGRESRAILCHITANESGQHHYQPELGASTGQVQGCRITAKHLVNSQHRYVFPVLDASVNDRETEQLKSLLRRMKRLSRSADENHHQFVYTLDEDQLNLVVPADMEEAIRRGDIENVHLSKSGQVALIRIKNGPSVTLNMRWMDEPDEARLLHGGGQDDATLQRQRRLREYKKRKGSHSFLGFRRRYFEEKEKENQPEEVVIGKKMKEESVPQNQVEDAVSDQPQVLDQDWHGRMGRLGAGTRAANKLLAIGSNWKDLVYPEVDTWDWDAFPKQAEIPQQLEVPQVGPPVNISISDLVPGLLPADQINAISDDTVGFETVPVFETIQPTCDQVPAEMAQDLQAMEPVGLEQLKDVFTDLESIMFLPFIHEVEDVTQALDAGIRGRMVRTGDGIRFVASDKEEPVNGDVASADVEEEETVSVIGAMVPLENEQRFIVGKPMKDNWIPGRANGHQFTAGMTVQTPEGVGFIPGLIFDGGSRKRFSAGEFMKTANGRQFVSGQALPTLLGPKFIPGQTIRTEQGLKFTAGQKNSVDGSFIPGQILFTANGAQFVSGVTFDTPQGARFVAGRVTADGQDFVPGQTIDGQFTAGEMVDTPDGPLFMPGLSIETAGEVKFHPGRNIAMPDGKVVFVPGETVVSKQMDTRQFIAGCILETEKGHAFVPCQVDESGIRPAAREEDVFNRPGLPDGLPIDNSLFSAVPWKKPDIGYMIQQEERVKFLPENQALQQLIQQAAQQVEKKAVPGQLLELHNLGPKFVPGKMIETALGSRFIPGQIVKTNRGEQFVPGQVVESKQCGPKFFPGQVVETRQGKRFVPGQVFDSRKNGPRFVPGKILHTSMGSTFIPGQVVYTDVGSRFLPGQVVDTSAGPYFVPGSVVEKNQSIRFVPGEIIETDEGPRYVVPETDDGIDDGEIRVQAFQVSPEELRLITAYPFPTLHGPLLDEPMINSRMLRQMAAAGIAVTKHTSGRLQEAVISVPNDHDEAILGANVFRQTEPVFEQRPRKAAPAKNPKSPPAEKSDPEAPPVATSLVNDAVDIDGADTHNPSQHFNPVIVGATPAAPLPAINQNSVTHVPTNHIDGDELDHAVTDTLTNQEEPSPDQPEMTDLDMKEQQMPTEEQERSKMQAVLDEEQRLKQQAQVRQKAMELLKQQEMLREQAILKQEELLKEQQLLQQQALLKEQEMLKEQQLLKEQAVQKEQQRLKEQELLQQQTMLKEQELLRMQNLFEEAQRRKEQEIINEKDATKRQALIKEQEMMKQRALEEQQELLKQQEMLKQEALLKQQEMLREQAELQQQAQLRKQQMLQEQEKLKHQALEQEQKLLEQQQEAQEREKLLKKQQLQQEQDALKQQQLLHQQQMLKEQEELKEQQRLVKNVTVKQQEPLKEEQKILNDEEEASQQQKLLEQQQRLRENEALQEQLRLKKQQLLQEEESKRQALLKQQEALRLKELAYAKENEIVELQQRLREQQLLEEQQLQEEQHARVTQEQPSRAEALSKLSAVELNLRLKQEQQSAAQRKELEQEELVRKQELIQQQKMLEEQEALRQAALQVSKRAKKILSASETQNAVVLEDLSLGRIMSNIFRRITDDPGVIESHADVGETLVAAVGWAEACGHLEMADKIRLLDVKALDDDPQVVQHMKDVIRLRSLAQDQPEVLELFDVVVNQPVAMAADQIQQVQAYLSGAGPAIPVGPGDPTGRDFFAQWKTSPLLFTGSCQFTSDGTFRWNSHQRRKASLAADAAADAAGDPTTPRYKKPPRSRRVQSRSSSRLCIPVDLCEEDELESTSTLPTHIINEDALPACAIPPVITSARDISKDVIDTLRYSNDDSLKDFYTQKILEAVGCAPSASPENEEHQPSSSTCRWRKESACIILKDFLQTIVPREAARSVLVGQVDYMIIDDDGVRYFESASGFASRRNSRYDIRLGQRSASSSRRNSRDDSLYDAGGPYPWADVAPHGTGRRVSIDEFRRKMHDGDAYGTEGRRSRAASTERHGRQRHSFAGFGPGPGPMSGRSSSGYSTPVDARSRRGSVDDVGILSVTARKRKVGLADNALASIRMRMQNLLPDSF